MGDLRHPVKSEATISKKPDLPDWQNPRLAPYVAAGLLTFDATISEAMPHVRGRTAYLASVPPFDALNIRELADTLGPALFWQRQFSRQTAILLSLVLIAFEAVMYDPAAKLPDRETWAAWCGPLFAGAGPVIVPPLRGWQSDSLIWQQTLSALAGNRRVFLMRGA